MFRMPPFSLACLALMILAGCHLDQFNGKNGSAITPAQLTDRAAVAKLLPADVRLDTVSESGLGGGNKLTVEDMLIRVQARISQDGKLVDAAGKPITFFQLTGCWGNPPANYQQIIDDQNDRLAELRKTHTVITLTCNPSGMPIP